MQLARATAGVLGVLALTACGAGGATSSDATSSGAQPAGAVWMPADVAPAVANGAAGCRSVVVAAGDIVNDERAAEGTGRLAAGQQADQVLVLGDNQYDSGALEDYRSGYDRLSWGRLKAITRPVPGNHEYRTPGAEGYFAYFGRPPPYYAYDAGCGWRGYALNSEIGMDEQTAWLRRDLAAHPDAAVLAFWHKPRWSSGTRHGNDASVQPLWDALTGRAGVVLNGHEHNYERFAPVGRVREFVAGTGGSSTYPFGTAQPGSQARIAQTEGVLRLELRPGSSYAWSFLAVDGRTLDTGSA